MCGIVGYVGQSDAKHVLIDGLKRLEYRGYDSAGIAILKDGELLVFKKKGKIAQLEREVMRLSVFSTVGIGHTRWATHGSPTDKNAHPHVDCSKKVAVVHNGIIENFSELKKRLQSLGHKFTSDTDTEVIAHLVEDNLKGGLDLFESVRRAVLKLKGSFALCVVSSLEPDKIVVARKDSPLIVGLGDGENFVASDVPAFLRYTKRAVFLDNGEMAVLKKDKVEFFDFSGKPLEKKVTEIPWSVSLAEKAGYKHFMLKEIYEQPRAISDTIAGRASFRQSLDKIGSTFDKVQVIACGTSYHAGLIAKIYFESIAGLSTEVDYASEYRYRDPIIDDRTLVVAISQSGETADTLAAVRLAKNKGARVFSVCNVIGSTLTRESDAVFYTHAGPEISVASTKAFTTQLSALYMMALEIAKKRGEIKDDEPFLRPLFSIPRLIGDFLDLEKHKGLVKNVALEFYKARDALYLGRFVNFPIALEGALKLKEISYIHAEGYPAGEMKHGPIALIDENMPVLVLATKDRVYEKMVSNIQEVNARKGKVIAVVDEAGEAKELSFRSITVPKTSELLSPLVNVVPLQLFAYYIADFLGYDVDQPRNLAKSVTVE